MIGLSFLSGEQLFYLPKVVEEMKKNNLDHVLLLVGGVISDGDVPILKRMGADQVFIPGTPMPTIIDFITRKTGTKG